MTAAPEADCAQRFPSRYRLRKRREFLSLQRDGRRHSTPHFVVITRSALGPSRLGVTTSRKVGNAPQRNRIRRVVRECFRRLRWRLDPAREVRVIARPGAAALAYVDVVHELSRALRVDAANE